MKDQPEVEVVEPDTDVPTEEPDRTLPQEDDK